MSSKIANYLQEHLEGEVLTSARARKFFATDASIFQLAPLMVVYPRSTNDVRKVARFTWQLAEKGHVLPITARGRGTDQTGAAIGRGISLVFPAHMNRLLELDSKERRARVQPGIAFRTLQDVAYTHGLFLPPYPASADYATIGGAIANNAAGEKSVKYGAMRQWIDRLEVVLANGEVIETRRLSKRELNRKKGQTDFEGEVYRQIDGLITDNLRLIQNAAENVRVSKNSCGYALANIKHKDGSFDLTPLFVGSQGTLGIITEAIVKLAPHAPHTELLVAEFRTLTDAGVAIPELLKLGPSAIEMVDAHLIDFIRREQPNRLKDLISEGETPAVVLLIEFDEPKVGQRRKAAKKAQKLLTGVASALKRSADYEEQQKMWAIRHSAATILAHAKDNATAVPIIEDGIVPQGAFEQYINGVYALLKKYQLDIAAWGHAGDANLHIQPFLDLSKLSDRQKAFRLMEEYYSLVVSLGGSITAEHNDGRLRAPFVEKQYGSELVWLFAEVRKVFDPFGTLNPGVKTGTTLKDNVALLRSEYDITHLSDFLPRT